MAKYYKAGDHIAELCKTAFQQRADAVAAALKISRRLGGSRTRVAFQTGFYGRLDITGFVFDGKQRPDASLLKSHNHDASIWTPRLGCKAGKALQKELDDLSVPYLEPVMDAIGMSPSHFGGEGVSRRVPGILEIAGDYYLTLPDDVKPKGCTRISDIAFEAFVAEHNAKEKAAKLAKKGKAKKGKASKCR